MPSANVRRHIFVDIAIVSEFGFIFDLALVHHLPQVVLPEESPP